LKIMEDVSDGFKLAEYDLKNRGSWEILGTMQSWQSDIPIEILSDLKFLERVHEWAKWILKHYPDLNELPALQNFLNEKIGDILA
jgi:RecG-like helicase